MAKYYDRCWNPIFGCKGNFIGCNNCYAKSLLQRREKDNYEFTDVSINKKQYKKIFDTTPQLISVCTQSDLFQDDIADNIISGVIRKCNKVNYNNYLFLTKYSGNMRHYFNNENRMNILQNNHFNKFTFDNMMFGVTVCINDDLYRVTDLNNTQLIKHRFVAFEPLYENITTLDKELFKDIEWVIIGCETGENIHECKIEWILNLIDFFNKLNIPIYINALPPETIINTKLNRKDIPFKI
jgi:protein gp37